MKAVLVLNGAAPDLQRLKMLSATCPVYAADGGAAACLSAGVRPEWVAGDFDSQLLADLPSEWKIMHFPEQDRTDFQKLLSTLPEQVRQMTILGGLGNRLDHTLTNLLIASEVAAEMEMVFEGEGQTLTRITPQCPYNQLLTAGSTLSLLPLEHVKGVRSTGLKWNLRGQDMGAREQLGQSNQVEGGEVRIAVESGTLFLWVDRSGQAGPAVPAWQRQ